MGIAWQKLIIIFMNKEQLLQELSSKISTGEISREEVESRFGLASITHSEAKTENLKKSASFSITKMLYVLGAAIVVVGIVIFVSQIWDDIGSLGRISVTLGLGLLITATGSILLKSKPDENIGTVFQFIGGALIPGGAVVTLSELSTTGDWTVAITFGVIFAFYLLLNYVHKNTVLTFFAIANGTTTVYLILNAVLGGPLEGWFGIRDIYQYLTMVIGISYLLLAHSFRNGWNDKIVGVLHFFGIVGFLGAAFTQVFDSILWQTFYFAFVIGGLWLSVFMKSRSILIVSTLFLIAHVSYITGEYFANSIGWPISLVILGFVFIGLGYVSININKKYIAN
mgnify:CR=1 FL=1